jgi:hypothetical protein
MQAPKAKHVKADIAQDGLGLPTKGKHRERLWWREVMSWIDGLFEYTNGSRAS